LTLIGLALFIGGLLLRRVPPAGLAVGAVIVGFGLGIPAIVIKENRSESQGGGGTAAAAPSGGTSTTGGTTTTGGGGTSKGKTGGAQKQASAGGGAELAKGKQLFTQSCGTCHTLADAGTNGQVGPVLDQVKPNEALVLKAIKNGGLGSGTMPANLYTGKDAQAVAKYVSSVAGK
jgi:mono/diheme cytochrome c family protein